MVAKRKKQAKKKTSTKNKLINVLLALLFILGLALIFNTQIRNWLIQLNGRSYALDTLSRDDIEKNMQANASFDFDAVESLSTEAVLRAQFANKHLPVIGAIALPSVQVNLPIFKGLSNIALLTGAGTMKLEQEMGKGNYALASHRVQDGVSLFSPIERSQAGELIYVTDLANVYTYEVTLVEKVDPSRVEFINDVEGKNLITLVTCGDMYATTRIIVQGTLKSTTPVSKAPQVMAEAFQMQQRTL